MLNLWSAYLRIRHHGHSLPAGLKLPRLLTDKQSASQDATTGSSGLAVRELEITTVIRNMTQPIWQAERWGFFGEPERNIRDLSHVSLLVFVVTAVAAGVLVCLSLSSEFGLGAFWSLVVVAVLFPLFCGWLVKERWHAKNLEAQIKRHLLDDRPESKWLQFGDYMPAGLLIVTSGLRICFANQAYLHATRQEPQEILGRKIQDVIPGTGIEDQAMALLRCPDPAASSCLDTLILADLVVERPVHVTLTRIAPWRGEDRILVVIEDLFQERSPRPNLPVEGYVC